MADNNEQEVIDKAKNLQEAQTKFWLPIVGIGIIIFGIYTFNQLNAFEQSGGEIRLHWVLYYAYDLGGKWLAGAILILIGSVITFSGVKAFLKK